MNERGRKRRKKKLNELYGIIEFFFPDTHRHRHQREKNYALIRSMVT